MKHKLLTFLALIVTLAAITGCDRTVNHKETETPSIAEATATPSASALATVASNTVAPITATTLPPTATSRPPAATTVPVTPTATPRPPAPAATPNPDWGEYRNDLFGYRLRLPKQATVKLLVPEFFPPDEQPSGTTYDAYLEQLRAQYPGVCAQVRYGLGYIYVSAPLNAGARYSPCGRTGVGESTAITETLTLPIDGALYETTESEFISPPGDTLVSHSHHIVFWLDDGSRIEIGSVPGTASWQDYMASTRDVLLQIVSSYQSLSPQIP